MLHSSIYVPYQQHYDSEVNLFCIFALYNAVWNSLGRGGILPTVGGYLLYKRKSSELWLLHILESLVEVFLKKLEILYFHINIYIFVDKFHCRQLKKVSDKFISP